MTNEEAIERVTHIKNWGGMTIPVAMRDIEALDIAIKALEEENKSGNCVLTIFGECSYSETGCSDCEIKTKIRKALEERPTGEWIEMSDNYGHSCYFCSRCGTQEGKATKICPNCKASMKRGEEDGKD